MYPEALGELLAKFYDLFVDLQNLHQKGAQVLGISGWPQQWQEVIKTVDGQGVPASQGTRLLQLWSRKVRRVRRCASLLLRYLVFQAIHACICLHVLFCILCICLRKDYILFKRLVLKVSFVPSTCILTAVTVTVQFNLLNVEGEIPWKLPLKPQ